MDKKRIEKEMREFELKIHYHFNDISWLAKAMGSIKIEIAGQGKMVQNIVMKALRQSATRCLNRLLRTNYLGPMEFAQRVELRPLKAI
jgi:hypothetical protein